LVIDAGSAVTIDIVDDHGYHLGGYILPGTSLMAKSLRRGTKNVKVDIVDTPSLVLATTTEDAVIKGSLLSLVSTIKTVAISHPFKLVITGGSALAILKHLEMDIDFVPDLVLDGLSTPGLEFITPSG
jgi:type III pantothenate kinase